MGGQDCLYGEYTRQPLLPRALFYHRKHQPRDSRFNHRESNRLSHAPGAEGIAAHRRKRMIPLRAEMNLVFLNIISRSGFPLIEVLTVVA